jgi:isoleucyl-tRNA synthetase
MTSAETQDKQYKDTLNLPVTRFPMKAGAAQREPEFQQFWDERRIYEKALANKDKAHKFILHDGPPYLSSDKIHIGTALNKILKDIVTRYRNQRGYYTPFVPGYDGHGLPIENAVVKNIEGGRRAISPLELRKRCRAFALDNLGGQEANFRRLGVWGNWAQPYVTIHGDFEAVQVRLFGNMVEKGYVYKGLKPVYWCAHCETALADAEVEYEDHTSHSIYVKFPFGAAHEAHNQRPMSPEVSWTASPERRAEISQLLDGASLVIWTTTPWTLPANVALSVHPDFVYTLIDSPAHGRLLVAKELLENFVQASELGEYSVLSEVLGKELDQLPTRHPFLPRTSWILNGTHVTLEAGTGIVHTAPGHGPEDYVAIQPYNRRQQKEWQIPIISPLDNRAVYTEEAIDPRLVGVFYEKANPVVLDILRDKEALIHHSQYAHSYPHCWRCHKPVIFRATDQWFIAVDPFRQDALDAIRQVQWIPAAGENRIGSMVENRTDWCISRQRVWGVPIPAFYCEACGKLHMTPSSIEKVAKLFHDETSDAWWEKSAADILGADERCEACESTTFRKETDVMDVWFDSGVTHSAVVEARHEELGHLPVELYLEGSDQHRGWFQSSLLTRVMTVDADAPFKAPYKSVLTHGFVLDEKGRKMSKSLGNVVDPNSVIKDYGADVLRLWVASVDFTHDVRVGKTIIAQLAEVYKKVRNTARFLLGNLADFNPATDRLPYERLGLLDKYVLGQLADVIAEMSEAFDTYEFHRFNQRMQNFCAVDLSSVYFDVAKDILYCNAKADPTRRALQTVLHELLLALTAMMVPVMPHLAEDIWQHMPESLKPAGPDGQPLESAVLLPWPQAAAEWTNATIRQSGETLLELRNTVTRLLEPVRAAGHIGSSLEASIILALKTDVDSTWDVFRTVLADTSVDLAACFIVSGVLIGEPEQRAEPPLASLETGLVTAYAYRAKAEKCERCWKYEDTVGATPEHPKLCRRCANAVCSL